MKTRLAILAMLLPAALFAQKASDYTFTTVKENPITAPKDQFESGTCWCHATTALLESEAIRINNITDPAKYPDFSELYTVYRAYQDRAVKYLRVNGHLTSGPGSLGGDLLHIVKEWGIVPQSAMPGKTELPQLRGMDKEIAAYLKGIIDDKEKLKTDWKKGLDKILTNTMGACPETFLVDGVAYNPAGYRDHYCINPDNYITLTSFTHHPFYEEFAIEVPDNWRWDEAWNITLDELLRTVYYAIDNGFTVAWGMDLSEPGWTWDGLAVTKVKEVTQESRQYDFDVQNTVDDHLMLVYGTALDQNGNKFFKVKNSAGADAGAFKGIWYASEPYFLGKTLYMTLHRDAIPADIRAKLGL